MHNTLDSKLNNPNINPYKTTYGSLLKIKDAQVALQVFINKLTPMDVLDMGYDVNYGDIKPILITGKNEEEEALPPFTFPIVIKAMNNTTNIAIDLRNYLTPTSVKKNNPKTYNELVNSTFNKSSLDCVLSIGKMMSNFLNNTAGFISFIKPALAKTYGTILVSLYNTRITTLNFLEQPKVKTAGILFYYLKSLEGDISSESEKILKQVSQHVDVELADGIISYFLGSNNNTFNTKALTEIVKDVVDGSKASITLDSGLFNNSKGEWFGLSGTGMIPMMMECDTLYIPILYYALTDNSFKKAKLTQLLNNVEKKDKTSIIEVLKQNLKFINLN